MLKFFFAKDSGVSKLTVLVFAPLISVAIYSAYHITPFYYNYFELVNQMESLVKVAGVHTDEELKKKLSYHMKKLGIPGTIDQVKFDRFGDRMHIRLSYEETFWVTWQGVDYDIHTFKFDADAEGNYSY